MFVDKIHLLSSKLVQILGIDGTRRLYDIPPPFFPSLSSLWKIDRNGNVESKIFEREINYRISTAPRKNSVPARFSCEASVRWQNFLVIYVILGREDRTKEAVFNAHPQELQSTT